MRIIAGMAKGREIIAPKGRDTRPTLAKVRGAIFGMVQFDVPGAAVLDLFSGSGALGLEALSRGADFVVFCDNDKRAVAAVKDNVERFGFGDKSQVYNVDALELLNRLAGEKRKFSIVLLDPPYAAELENKAIKALVELDLLENEAIIICEHDPKSPPIIEYAGLTARDPRKYGDSSLTYITFSEVEQG